MKSVTIINGITKVTSINGFVYNFPLQVIETITQGNYLIRRERGNSSYEQIRFSELDDNLGASDIEGYADLLCEGGYFKDSNVPTSAINEANASRGTGIIYSDYEIRSLELFGKMQSDMKEMIFLLKSIAE